MIRRLREILGSVKHARILRISAIQLNSLVNMPMSTMAS